jgi:Metallo-peptidase family M12B Reprolysin-like
MGFRQNTNGDGQAFGRYLRRKRRPRASGRRFQHEALETRLVLSSSTIVPISEDPADLWTMLDQIPPSEIQAESILRPETFVPFEIDHEALRSALDLAPLEFTEEASLNQFSIDVPTPNGSLETFEILETMVMHPDLAAKFPDIKTYRGQGIDNPANTIRLDLTPLGFHAQVLSPGGSYYIDPYYHLDRSVYMSYARDGLQLDPETTRLRHEMFGKFGGCLCPECLAASRPQEAADASGIILNDQGADGGGSFADRSGTQLRTYRLANAATGEYTARFGGTVAGGQAAIATAVNRVTGVYEVELAIRLQLVPNNDLLVYTNSGTDPYTNSDGVAMLGQNQTTITTVIGSANYDIGHVFSTGGGGVAGLGVVGVNASKARGVTGLPNPVGDAFYIDYVAHEMGHQFGGNHSFNGDSGSCAGGNRNASTAYEPGSGSTIMAYAGICGNDDLQSFSDPYFHSISFDEIIRYVDVTRPSVGTRTATGNLVPTANAGSDFTIPAQTPFKLTGVGSDGNGDAITYNWEERDLGAQQDVSAADNGASPLWRSWNATTSPERYFPRLQNLVNNTTVRGEKYALTTRNMNFRLTVRDNRSGGGGVNTDDMLVRSVNTGAAFAVTAPNTNVAWAAGSTQTVTWNVAGTTGSGINTSQVNIRLSTDGGLTYPTILASATSNDGSESITLPNLASTTARIMVEAVGNIYFDISNVNFSITLDTTAPSAFGSAADMNSPGGTAHIITVTYVDGTVIDVSDIDGSDIQVVTPTLNVLPASLVTVSSPTDTSPVIAVYSIVPPGGVWDAADNGLYTIQMLPNQVTDGAENPVAAGNIGMFNVNIASTAPGDFDSDGNLDCDDVNALSSAIANATGNLLYDVTGDSAVTSADLNEWVLNLKNTLIGDINLDFVVDVSDFNIWNAFKFTANTDWCSGNLNADLFVDASDFNLWNANKFTSAMRPPFAPFPVAARESALQPVVRLPELVTSKLTPVAIRESSGSPRENTPAKEVPITISAPKPIDGSAVSRQKLKARELRDRVFAEI